MTNQLITFFLFIGVCYIIYIIFRNSGAQEGFTKMESFDVMQKKPDGISDGAASYAANLKSQVIKMQDIANMGKYKRDYESAILSLDDLVNNLMLNEVLSIDLSNPTEGLTKLGNLNNAKSALNNVMKFVDKS